MQVSDIILSYFFMVVTYATGCLDTYPTTYNASTDITDVTYATGCLDTYPTTYNASTDITEKIYESIKDLLDTIPKLINDSNVVSKFNITSEHQHGLQNEDLHLNITQLIAKNGYPVEQHEMTTTDGYVLNIFRIPGNGSIVFVMHGLQSSSDDWVTTGPDRGLAYLLAAAGHDVWLGNARGNVHCRRNIYISVDSAEFWDFSWDEIGRIDVPTMIDYILEYTNQSTLQYIGHSQGTTSFYVMCSEKPKYNEKISLMIALSAVAWMGQVKGPLVKILGLLSSVFTSGMSIHGQFEIPSRNNTNTFTDIACNTPETAVIICNNLLFLLCGFDYFQVNSSYLPTFYAHGLAGSSSKTYVHYLQLVSSKQFRQYDYGSEGNLKKYGSNSPPNYLLENITTPIVIFYADNDWLSSLEDVLILANKLPNLIELYRVPFAFFNHLDYLIANDVKTLVYDKVITFLSN